MSKYMGFSASDKKNIKSTGDDDWDTDPNYVNDISEKDQRWGSKEIGGKPKEVVNMNDLRNKVKETDDKAAKDEYTKKPNSSYGYGGKFGVQTDRMDKSAHTNVVEEKDNSRDSPNKPQGPLKDTRSAAKVFEQKAAALKPEPVKPTPKAPAANKFVASPPAPNKFVASPPAPKFTPKPPEPEPEPEPEPVRISEPENVSFNDDWGETPSSAPPAPPVDEWTDNQPTEQIVEEGVTETNIYTEDVAPTGAPSGDLPAQVRALYDFDAQDTEELEFKAGDIITIIQAVDTEWWQGEKDGRVGIFPVSYVENF